MSGKIFASLICMTLLAAGAGDARPSDMKPGDWTRETRQVGNKVTIDVYHRAPYALTGTMVEPARRSRADKRVRETRHLGNKVTLDVYRR